MPDPVTTVATGLALEAGKKALAEQRDKNRRVSEELVEQAAGTPGFRRAAELLGEREAQKQAVFKGLFAPAVRFSEMVAARFGSEIFPPLSERLGDISEEDLQSPKPGVAVPALEGLALSLDEPDLKKLYIELLGTASDSKVARSAHPSFVEIIKQLSSEEAGLLPTLLSGSMIAIVRLDRVDLATQAFSTVHAHLIPFQRNGTTEPRVYPYLGTWVDNWIRLGLVDVNYEARVDTKNGYNWVLGRPEYQYAQSLYDSETHKVTYRTGVVQATTFGKQFAKAVGMKTNAE